MTLRLNGLLSFGRWTHEPIFAINRETDVGGTPGRRQSAKVFFPPVKSHLPLHKAIHYADTTKRTTRVRINLPFDVWELLNRVAFQLAKERGGRPSVSGLLVDLVQRHRRELEKELD